MKKLNLITRESVQDIVLALIGLIPYSEYIQGTTKHTIELILSELTEQNNHEIETIVSEMYNFLIENAASLSPDDPGRASAAAYNIIETIRKSKLDVDKIIECNLDSLQLYEYLKTFPAEGIEFASYGRQNIYHKYLKQFAKKIIDTLYKTESFKVKLHSQILKNQRDILTLLNNNIEQGATCDNLSFKKPKEEKIKFK